MMALYLLAALLACLLGAVLMLETCAPARAAVLGLALERRRAGLSWDSATIPGADMPYLEGGHGETVVLLHGFGGDKDNFVRTVTGLTRHYHVVIPDLPGFGEASRDAGADADYSIARQVDNLAAFLYKLGLERVHLGGHSMGGFIAAEFAARHPAQVASLWLLSPAGTSAGRNGELERRYAATGAFPWLLPHAAAIDELIAAATARPLLISPSYRRHLGLRGAADFALHTRIMRQLQDSPFLEARFYRIETPALIVWGEADRIHLGAGADALHAIMPNSTILRMPGIGHLAMVDAPRQCADNYLAFLVALARQRVAAGADAAGATGAATLPRTLFF